MPRALGLNDVPWWLGWLGLPLGLTVIGLPIYSIWAHRRGRRDGVGREATEPPYDNFGWRVVGWSAAAIILPFIGWYVFAHLPTLCYKHGLRVGAKEGTASERFTSVPAVVGAAVAPAIAVVVGLTTLGIIISGGFSSANETPYVPPPPVIEETIEPTFTMSEALELTQEAVAANDAEAFRALNARAIQCVSARFQPENLLWLVRCEFLAEDRTTVIGDRNYLFDDTTGEVRSP